MPSGINAGRTRADRKKITVPVTVAELAIVDRAAHKDGLSRAEYVRQRVLTGLKVAALCLLAALTLSACGAEPLPGEPTGQDATPATVEPTPDAKPATADAMPAHDSAGDANPCAIPDGYTLVLTGACPGTNMSVCIAQDSAYVDAPPGTTKINLAGCKLAARPDVMCVSACPGALPPAPDAHPPADATPAPLPADAAPVFSCDIPADDTVIISSCPGLCKVCVAQDYAFIAIPDGITVHKINMAGCALAGRPDIACVSDCSAPCPQN